MRCALPMYPFPAASLDEFWSGLRHYLRLEGVDNVPHRLGQPQDLLQHWQEPDLLLSQTCGYPVSTVLHGKVQVVGAFDFDVPGCEQANYSSSLWVRQEDAAKPLQAFGGTVAACNERHSQSGYHALRSAVAPFAVNGRFFSQVVFSGAHRQSARLIAGGQADIAALDCVSAYFLSRQEPETFSRLAAIGFTAPMSGLPLITSSATPPATLAALRRALAASVKAPELENARSAMRISGFSILDQQDYRICALKAEQNRTDGLADW